jgi:uncharacterized protein GlcG (DUF336 family)
MINQRKPRRPRLLEQLEPRFLMNADCGAGLHNALLPADVNADSSVSAIDALSIVNLLNAPPAQDCDRGASGESVELMDVSNDGWITPMDVLLVVNYLNAEGEKAEADRRDPAFAARLQSSFNEAAQYGPQNLLTKSDVEKLLTRASQASRSKNAIIAIVDRVGRILGVRVEEDAEQELKAASMPGQAEKDLLAFAIDGAVAKARTAAFFSSNAAPLTSRTVRFISQSTVTQREVESSPLNDNNRFKGPGFVAPIGVGGHFPPEIPFTPQVDLFAIEHQSRDRQMLNPGPDMMPGTPDDIDLVNRFNAHPLDLAEIADNAQALDSMGVAFDTERFFREWPESYGVQSGTSPGAQARGIATLPGGIPLFKFVTKEVNGKFERTGNVNLVGGIGVFFPGENGFASYEQNFRSGKESAELGKPPQSEKDPTNAELVLESEYIALAAAAGGGIVGPSAFIRDVSELNKHLVPCPDFVALNGRIDLVGITLEIYGPTPTRFSPLPGIDQLFALGLRLGPSGESSGTDYPVTPGGEKHLSGEPVPEEWLIVPHDASDSSLTAEQVEQIIAQGIQEAEVTRAAIRLDVDNNFRPGERTRMVFAVADTQGELLGVYRMPDATVFSIDVAIAKARNTAYYADAEAIVDADRIDFNGDGIFGPIATSLNSGGDTVPKGTSLTNRTFRFLAEPRYPTGAELPEAVPGPQSILRYAGIDPKTGENTGMPLEFSVYADASGKSTTAFDAFVPGRNFRDPGDEDVRIAGTDTFFKTANQNGVVFFPGSTPLYIDGKLVGGFGVSGDGVDQDDVVTAAGQVGFATPDALRVDQFVVGDVRLPFQKFNRNPRGA